ncbi:MAG: hypothetical protein ACM31G_11690, partial [Flavobacteriales bacterium]
NYLKLIGMVGLVFFVCYLLPENTNIILNLFLKVGINASVIIFITYKMKWVYSLNYWVDTFIKPYKL